MASNERRNGRQPAPEVIAPAGGNPPVNRDGPVPSTRLAERFIVADALAICARRSFLGIWKTSGVPFRVQDIGLGGLSLRHFGAELAPGMRVRLNILLPKCPPISAKGIVIWNKADPATGARDGAQLSRICGVKFVDYGAEAWAVLGGLHRFACGVAGGEVPKRATEGAEQPPVPSPAWLVWTERD